MIKGRVENFLQCKIVLQKLNIPEIAWKMDSYENTSTKCIVCGKSFLQLLRHVMTSSCKKYFPNDELKALKEKSKSKTKEKDCLRQKLAHDAKIKSSSAGEKMKCKVCLRKFAKNGLLKHLSKSIKCTNSYPSECYQKLKDQSKIRKAMYSKLNYDPSKQIKSMKESKKGWRKWRMDRFMKTESNWNETFNRPVMCEVCQEYFPQNVILKHIANSSCKDSYQDKSLQELRNQCSIDIKRRKSKRRKQYIREQKDEYLKDLHEKHIEESKKILKKNKVKYESDARCWNEIPYESCLEKIAQKVKENEHFKELNIVEELGLEFESLEQEIEHKYKVLDNEINKVVLEVKDVEDDWDFVTKRFYRLNGNWKIKCICAKNGLIKCACEKNGLIKNEWNQLENKVHEKIKAISSKHGVPWKCEFRKGYCPVCQPQKSVLQYPNKAFKKKKVQTKISLDELDREKEAEEDPNFESKAKPSVPDRENLKRKCCKKLDFPSEFFD